MSEAVYTVLLSRACPGTFTLDQMRHHVPLSMGHALIHAARILDGDVMIWPDPSLSRRGRWWQRVRDLFAGRRDGG